jgi:hypothetical protein
VIRLASASGITINGSVKANGGAGGQSTVTCAGQNAGGGGGGGSGGLVYLYSPVVNVSGAVSAVGGAGGSGGQSGGAGGLGRIRLALTASQSTLTGSFNPPLQSGSANANTAGFTYINSWPN